MPPRGGGYVGPLPPGNIQVGMPMKGLYYPRPSFNGIQIACWLLMVLLAALAGVALFKHLQQPHVAIFKNLQQPHVGASQDMLALVEQAGDDNAERRGTVGTQERKVVNEIFAGTHTEEPSGPVVLSAKAAELRAALLQSGFSSRILYHGTYEHVGPKILNKGFRFAAIGFHGNGIYVAEDLSHAMCYGNAVIECEVYSREPVERYLKHVPSDNEMDDVYKVMDPLIIIPRRVRHITGQDMIHSTCI